MIEVYSVAEALFSGVKASCFKHIGSHWERPMLKNMRCRCKCIVCAWKKIKLSDLTALLSPKRSHFGVNISEVQVCPGGNVGGFRSIKNNPIRKGN